TIDAANIPALISSLRDNYASAAGGGIETASPSLRRSMLKLADQLAQFQPKPERVVTPGSTGKRRSPLFSQHEELKKRHPGMWSLFRVGDFYAMFGEDGAKAAEVLGLALAYRQDGDERIAMAGFPHHAPETHLRKMLQS